MLGFSISHRSIGRERLPEWMHGKVIIRFALADLPDLQQEYWRRKKEAFSITPHSKPECLYLAPLFHSHHSDYVDDLDSSLHPTRIPANTFTCVGDQLQTRQDALLNLSLHHTSRLGPGSPGPDEEHRGLDMRSCNGYRDRAALHPRPLRAACSRKIRTILTCLLFSPPYRAAPLVSGPPKHLLRHDRARRFHSSHLRSSRALRGARRPRMLERESGDVALSLCGWIPG